MRQPLSTPTWGFGQRRIVSVDQRPDESVRDFLDRRETALMNQIAALQSQIANRCAELMDVKRAQGALQPGALTTNIEFGRMRAALNEIMDTVREIGGVPGTKDSPVLQTRNNALLDSDPLPIMTLSPMPYRSMTLKALIIQAMIDKFPNGATARELIDFFHDAYGRVVSRSVLSPQLSRLANDGGILKHDEGTSTWRFARGVTLEEAVMYGVSAATEIGPRQP